MDEVTSIVRKANRHARQDRDAARYFAHGGQSYLGHRCNLNNRKRDAARLATLVRAARREKG